MTRPPSGRDEPDRPPSARPSKPTPVRALENTPRPRSGEPGPPPERTTFESGGRVWVAEVAGQGGGPARGGGPGLLLLKLEPEGPGDDPGPREGWVVGARLSELTEFHLERALARSGPWREDRGAAPFFTEEGGRRGR
jgi:hypothetical protein